MSESHLILCTQVAIVFFQPVITNFQTMTLQNAVDYTIFLIKTTIDMQRFSDGIVMAPGAIAGCGPSMGSAKKNFEEKEQLGVVYARASGYFCFIKHLNMKVDAGALELPLAEDLLCMHKSPSLSSR